MAHLLDDIDRSILRLLQKDASLSIEAISDKVALSRNACWRRIRQMEQSKVIKSRVALVSPEAVNLGLTAIVLIRTGAHDPDWLGKFKSSIRAMPEIVGAHRMSGDLDYILRVRVADVQAYDRFYQNLISQVPIANVSASFVMEDIKDTTELPV